MLDTRPYSEVQVTVFVYSDKVKETDFYTFIEL